MPYITFTVAEIASSLLAQMRDAAGAITELSDLKRKPLDPGESPDARRHKIAKLGKRLAEVCQSLSAVMDGIAASVEAEAVEPAPPASAPDQSQAN